MTPLAAIPAATPHPPGVGGLIAVVLLAVILLLFGLDRLALWMQRRGWISYRNQKRPMRSGGGGATAGLLTEFQKIVEPRIEHRIQVMEERNESIGQRLGRGDDVVKPKKDAADVVPHQ